MPVSDWIPFWDSASVKPRQEPMPHRQSSNQCPPRSSNTLVQAGPHRSDQISRAQNEWQRQRTESVVVLPVEASGVHANTNIYHDASLRNQVDDLQRRLLQQSHVVEAKNGEIKRLHDSERRLQVNLKVWQRDYEDAIRKQEALDLKVQKAQSDAETYLSRLTRELDKAAELRGEIKELRRKTEDERKAAKREVDSWRAAHNVLRNDLSNEQKRREKAEQSKEKEVDRMRKVLKVWTDRVSGSKSPSSSGKRDVADQQRPIADGDPTYEMYRLRGEVGMRKGSAEKEQSAGSHLWEGEERPNQNTTQLPGRVDVLRKQSPPPSQQRTTPNGSGSSEERMEVDEAATPAISGAQMESDSLRKQLVTTRMECRKLQTSHANEVALLKEAHDVKVTSLTRAHEVELSMLKKAYETKTTSLKQDMSLMQHTGDQQQVVINDLRQKLNVVRSPLQEAQRGQSPPHMSDFISGPQGARQTQGIIDGPYEQLSRPPSRGPPQRKDTQSDSVDQELASLRQAHQAQARALESERTSLQRMHRDKLQEVYKLEGDIKNLKAELDRWRSGKKGDETLVQNLRNEVIRIQREAEIERGEKLRAQKAYEDNHRENLRLQEEAITLRTFLNQADTYAVSDLVKDLQTLNSRISHLATSLSMEWEDDDAGPLPSPEILNKLQTEAAPLLLPALGETFLDLLMIRSHGLKDDRDSTLVLFALQSCAVRCITAVLEDFCYGFSNDANDILDRIYKTMYQKEMQALSSRWRALAHAYARTSNKNYERCVQDAIIENLSRSFSAIHSFVGGRAGVESTIKEEYGTELEEIASHAIMLSIKVKEQMMSAKFEVFIGEAGRQVEGDLMEDAFGQSQSDQAHIGPILCGVEMGLVQSVKGRNEEHAEESVLLRAKVVAQGSVQAKL